MDKMTLDALNRGWSLGFATGKVRAVSELDADRLTAEANARNAEDTAPAETQRPARPRIVAQLAAFLTVGARRVAAR